MPPEKIGRYEIKSELGRGGFATVYLAYDPLFEREVAIKCLPPELIHSDQQFRTRFERESKIIAQLEHPAIVPVYDVGQENNQPYFVMRYMNGGSLSDRIKTKAYSVEEALKVLEQIAPGLDEAHAKGIIHRDLKPGNILFTNNGLPLIADFGIAKFSQGDGQNVTGSAVIGTPAYISPEQASGEDIDGRTDIYALGVILYEMLTGQQPYQADTPLALVVKHITEPVPRILDANPNLPAWMDTVIATAMAKKKEDRYATAVKMTEAIKAFARTASSTLVAHAPSNTRAPKRRSFLPLAFGIFALALLALGLGARALSLRREFRAAAKTTEISSYSPTVASPIPTLANTLAAPTADSFTATAAPTIESTAAPISALPVVGGADKIAFVRNADIWMMNIDGSDLTQLTTDGVPKFNLQWLAGGKTLLYMSGKSVKTVDIETLREETIMRYQAADYFESFQVSPDGTQAALSVNRELFVVPFDPEKLIEVSNRNHLLALNGCIFYDKFAVTGALWSQDGKRLAIKFLANKSGTQVDAIRLIDITKCKDATFAKLDEFPIGRFEFGRWIEHFSWNGESLFYLNSSKRNEGFGDLLFYNGDTHKFELQAPYEGNCCYRDASFSPDGSYVIFAFQDIRLGTNSPINLYYLPSDTLSFKRKLEPIPLPDNFFTQRTEKPLPALRPTQ